MSARGATARVQAQMDKLATLVAAIVAATGDGLDPTEAALAVTVGVLDGYGGGPEAYHDVGQQLTDIAFTYVTEAPQDAEDEVDEVEDAVADEAVEEDAVEEATDEVDDFDDDFEPLEDEAEEPAPTPRKRARRTAPKAAKAPAKKAAPKKAPAKGGDTAKRDARILKLLGKGKTQAQVAEEVGVSKGVVWRVKQAA